MTTPVPDGPSFELPAIFEPAARPIVHFDLADPRLHVIDTNVNASEVPALAAMAFR